MLSSVELGGRRHDRDGNGEFDVDDRDVKDMRHFGLRPKGEEPPKDGK